MRLLGVFHCIDIINYHMIQAMRGKGIETYATYTSDEEREALPKECVALRIPHFKSKFKYASIKEVRSIIKKYRIDVIYASSSIDLSIALFASSLFLNLIHVAEFCFAPKIR